MKKLSFLIFIPLITFFFSCEKEETTKTLSTTITQYFVFNVNEGDPTTFNLEEIVDPSQDSKLQPFKGEILNYKITNITYSYSDYKEDNIPNVRLD